MKIIAVVAMVVVAVILLFAGKESSTSARHLHDNSIKAGLAQTLRFKVHQPDQPEALSEMYDIGLIRQTIHTGFDGKAPAIFPSDIDRSAILVAKLLVKVGSSEILCAVRTPGRIFAVNGRGNVLEIPLSSTNSEQHNLSGLADQ